MKNKIQLVTLLVVVLGVVSLAIGAALVGVAVQKNNYVVDSLRAQNITLGLTKDQIAQGQLVDNADEAMVAANTLAEHLKSIAPTYNDLMAANKGGKYDTTVANDLQYTAGLNLENSFNMVVLSFGVIQVAMVTGAALIVVGLAFGSAGLVLFKLSK